MKRLIVVTVALAGAIIVQLTIVNGLPLAGGGAPDLVLLCVVAVGLTAGPRAGLMAGFWAGLALDLTPPDSQLAGQYALVFCLTGYVCGRLSFTVRRSAVLAIAIAAAAAAIGEAMAAMLTLALDARAVTLTAVAQVLPSSMLYDALVSPLILLVAVRLAMALGISFSLFDDTPAAETGGSAAQSALAGAARHQRPGRAWQGIGGSSRAAAGGRWLAGDDGGDGPAVGEIGWLAGPVRSRRARQEQARLTATLTGANPRGGAFWVGGRPPGLVPAASPSSGWRTGLARIRPGSGVAGSARQAGMPPAALAARPVRLDLAGERRRQARAAAKGAAGGSRPVWPGGPGATGHAAGERHGPGRHGLDGPWVPRIAFGTGGLPGAGRAAGRGVPRIAFGTGSLPGDRRAVGGGVPRIAFGTGSLAGTGRAPGRGVPRIAFGSGGLPGAGRAAGRGVPRIAFGSGARAGHRAGTSRLAAPRFHASSARFRPGAGRYATGPWLARSALTIDGTVGLAYSGSAFPVRPATGRRIKIRGTHGGHAARVRQPKTARHAGRRRSLRWLPLWRHAGDRSTVWRIGSTMGGSR